MMLVVLDISRLICRSRFATPTGIDRFELGYARWHLDRHGRKAVFIETGHAGPVMVSWERARKLIGQIEQRWSSCDVSLAQAARFDAILAAINGKMPWSLESADVSGHPTVFGKALTALKGLTGAGSPPPREAQLLHVSHSRLERPSAFAWLDQQSQRGTFYVHDLIPLSHPEYVRIAEPGRHMQRMETVLSHAGLVLCNSQATAFALDQLAAGRGLPQPRTAILRPGVDDSFCRLSGAPAQTNHPYFVCVSTIEPRKNHTLLLNLWRRLVERDGAAAPRLVIVGRRGWDNADLFKLLNRMDIFQGTVIEVSDLPDAPLARLIAGATALLAPSFVEGYGMPVAEALALGTPVIASNIRSHREIAGSSAVLLDPLNGPGWFAAIDAHVSMPARFRTAPSIKWTWADHFRGLENLLAAETRTVPRPFSKPVNRLGYRHEYQPHA